MTEPVRKIIDGVMCTVTPYEPKVSTRKGRPCPAKGRPSKYDPKHCDTIVEVARAGGDDAAMAIACGLSDRKNMWQWRQKYPEFAEAYNYAKLVKLQKAEILLEGYAYGKVPKGNFKALEWQLKNLDPDKYGSLKPEVAATTQINIHGDINSLAMVDLDKRIKETMARLGTTIEHDETEIVIDENG